MLRVTRTENGAVRGLPAADPLITVYKGIPFAAPPVGKNRWRVPQPAEDWEGVRDCYTSAPAALQQIPLVDFDNMYVKEFWSAGLDMSEDCLYLNVWTPAKSTEERLPVMVWIHGGGMQCGYTFEPEFDGTQIARRGVVFVSIPYRVSALGFLAHPELTAETGGIGCTNFGLYDQKAALEWVKRNIANFGGDPDCITIFGQSAGGRSVLFQLTTPLNTPGLFHRAIDQSGGGIGPGRMSRYPSLADAERLGEEFFEYLGVKTLAEARALPGETIRHAGVEFCKKYFWSVAIDGHFVPDDPNGRLVRGERLPVPLLCGYTRDDMGAIPLGETTAEFEAMVRERFPARAEEIIRLSGSASCDMAEVRKNCGMKGQRFPMELLAMRSADAQLPAYVYEFDVDMPGDDAGAFHSSELWFVFETLGLSWRPFTGVHYDLARQMCNYWTNFAKNGDPNGIDADGTPMPKWECYTKDVQRKIRFEKVPAMDGDAQPAVRAMLDCTAEELWRK